MTPRTPTLAAPARTGPSLTGTVLADRYDLGSLLGRGGMGEVYEAFDRRLGREVAIKVLTADLAADGRFLARFRREARTVASLSHPGIVAVHDFGTDDATAFIVMELVRGTTLARVIAERGRLPADEAARIAADIAEALAYAHRRGVVHRDVSSGNVMVTPSGSVKVFDFGIARVEPRTATGDTAALTSLFGTAAYLPPEQARGERGDARSDVYGLGAVTYEALTGRPPFDGESAESLVLSHVEAAPRHVAALAHGVPVALAAVVMRCLEKDPEDRWPGAEELAAALRRSIRAPRAPASVPALPAPPAGATTTMPGAMVRITAARSALIPERRTPIGDGAAARSRWRWPRRSAAAASVLSTVLLVWLVIVPVWSALSSPPTKHGRASARPLDAPTDLAATGACDGLFSTRIALAWTAVSLGADGYEVYRATERGGPYEPVGRVVSGGAGSAYVDATTGIDATYHYVVRALSDDGRIGPVSDEATASTPLVCLG